mgnify:CR=1 FL=1
MDYRSSLHFQLGRRLAHQHRWRAADAQARSGIHRFARSPESAGPGNRPRVGVALREGVPWTGTEGPRYLRPSRRIAYPDMLRQSHITGLLTLDPDAQALLRHRLADVIGDAGVDARAGSLVLSRSEAAQPVLR